MIQHGPVSRVVHHLDKARQRAGDLLVGRRCETEGDFNSGIRVGPVIVPQRLDLDAHHLFRRVRRPRAQLRLGSHRFPGSHQTGRKPAPVRGAQDPPEQDCSSDGNRSDTGKWLAAALHGIALAQETRNRRRGALSSRGSRVNSEWQVYRLARRRASIEKEVSLGGTMSWDEVPPGARASRPHNIGIGKASPISSTRVDRRRRQGSASTGPMPLPP